MATPVDILNSEGQRFTIDPSELNAALQQGFRIPSAEETKQFGLRDVAAQSPIASGIAAGTGEIANAMTMGAFKPLLQKFAPEKAALLEAAEANNPGITGAGEVAGFGASLLNPAFGLIGKAGKTVGAGVADAVGTSAFGKAAATAANFGTQGVLASTPYAVSQEIAGNPDSAQEALIAGGLGGATLGGGISLMGSLLSSLGNAAGKIKTGKLGEYFGNKAEEMKTNAEGRVIGASMAERAKIGEQRYNDAVQWSKNNGIFDILQTPGNKLEIVTDALDNAGTTIGNIIDEADKTGLVKINTEKLLDDFKSIGAGSTKFRTSGTRSAFKQAFGDLVDLVGPRAPEAVTSPVLDAGGNAITTVGAPQVVQPTLRQLYEFKNALADKGYTDKGMKLVGSGKMLAKLERTVNDAIGDGLASLEGSDAATQWLKAKDDFKNATIVQKMLKKMVARGSNRGISPSDFGSAGIGGIVGGAPGAVAGYFLNELRHEFGANVGAKIIGGISDAVRGHSEMIASGVNSLFNIPEKLASSNVLPATLATYADQIFGGKHDKNEAMERFSDALSTGATNPAAATTALAGITLGLPAISPDLAQGVHAKLLNSVQYLAEQLPKKPGATSAFTSAPPKFSESQIAAFQRKVAIAMNPYSVIHDMKAGTLNRDSVEALKAMYPEIYNKLVTAIISKSTELKAPIPFQRRIPYATLLGSGVDSTLEPAFINALQGTYNRTAPAPSQPGPQNNQKPGSAGDISSRRMTDVSRISG